MIVFIAIFALFSCKKSITTLSDQSNFQLMSNHGLVAFQTDTLDYISSIRLIETATRVQHMISKVDKGVHFRVFQLPEGNYCVAEFVAYSTKFVFDTRKMCFYVEADEINDGGSLAIRGGTSRLYFNEKRFVYQLNRYYPNICKQYIGAGCS